MAKGRGKEPRRVEAVEADEPADVGAFLEALALEALRQDRIEEPR